MATESFVALDTIQTNFSFLLYGYDWLAFAHFVIAIAFAGPFRNPVPNIWVIEFGMISFALILPYAFAFCVFREISFWWTAIDCSFGIFGFIPPVDLQKENTGTGKADRRGRNEPHVLKMKRKNHRYED